MQSDMIPVSLAHTSSGEGWLERNAYLAAWLQGVGTVVALLAVIVALEHFRRGGFRPRISVIKDIRNRCVSLTVENRGRTDGRIDRVYGGRMMGPRWRPARWKDFEIDQDVRVRMSGSDPGPTAASPFPLILAGATAEDLIVESDSAMFGEPNAVVAVLAGGHRKIARLGRARSMALHEAVPRAPERQLPATGDDAREESAADPEATQQQPSGSAGQHRQE